MAVSYGPEVGEWYLSITGDSFEVVAYDAEEGTVEIQYFDGAIEELDMETWMEVAAEPIEPPEDVSGSLDMMREDFGLDDGSPAYFAGNPLDDLDL